jgi:hypothetical protein
METSKFKSHTEDPTTPLYCCDCCAKQGIHVASFDFCSVSCVDAVPIILHSDLKTIDGKLNKAQLKKDL